MSQQRSFDVRGRAALAVAACAVVCLAMLAVVALGLRRDARPFREAATVEMSKPHGAASAGEQRRGAPSAVGAGDGSEDAAAAVRVAAATVVTVAPQPEPGASSPPPLPSRQLVSAMAAELARAVALWKPQARAVLAKCGRGRERRWVELEVVLVPAPRAAGRSEQQLRPEWIAASPEALRVLADRHEPFELSACLQAVRGLPLQVELSGEALTHAFPSSIERVAVAL